MVDSVGGSNSSRSSGASPGSGSSTAGADKSTTSTADKSTTASANKTSTTDAKAVGATRGLSGPTAQDTADIEAAVKAETPHAEAAALEGDTFSRDATTPAATTDVAARAVDPAATADDPAKAADATTAADDATKAADEAAKAADPAAATPTEISAEAMAAYDAVDAKLRDGQWSTSPEAATAVAAEARAALAGLPADQQKEAREALMGPVDTFAQNLADPNTGRITPERVATLNAFSDMVGQRTVDALAGHLRDTDERGELPARDAIAKTLDDIGRTNQDTAVQTSAARTLLAGPVGVVRDAMAGKIDGLSVESMAHLSRTRGDVASDQRLRAVAEGMDPSVMGRLEAYGIQHEEIRTQIPEGLHTALDLAGLVPVLGEPADAFNAELYREEGRYADAAISAAGVLTGAGAIGTVGRLLGKTAREGEAVADLGTAARLTGEAREIAAEEALRARGLDARRWNQEINGTDIDVMLSTPQGRFGVLVGGDAKGLRFGELSEEAVQESLTAFRRADEALRDVDGVFRADGMGALMAFPRGTDPRVLDRFIQELGPQRVLMF